MNIIGIDASLSSTGLAIMDSETKEIIYIGKITTTSKQDEDERIKYICEEIIKICEKYNVKLTIMESQFTCTLNIKVGLQLSRLRGALAYALLVCNIKTIYYAPLLVKELITGYGKSTKEDVADSIIKLYKNNKLVKNLGPLNDKKNKNKNSDMYDAIAICLSYIYENK